MKTEEKVEVKKLVLKIEDKEVSLSMEQAKKLKEILNELFGKEIVKEIIREEHHHDHYPLRIWYYQPATPVYEPNKFYCGTVSFQANTKALNCNL